jgi:metal-sulfur cluster biosynthetic enzyme
MGDVLGADVRDKVEIIPTVKRADVELVFDPPWNQSMMSEAAQLQSLRHRVERAELELKQRQAAANQKEAD